MAHSTGCSGAVPRLINMQQQQTWDIRPTLTADSLHNDDKEITEVSLCTL